MIMIIMMLIIIIIIIKIKIIIIIIMGKLKYKNRSLMLHNYNIIIIIYNVWWQPLKNKKQNKQMTHLFLYKLMLDCVGEQFNTGFFFRLSLF